ncbi:hypothetical protein MYX78_04805 [Acidobacteria bacterium AH-259-G07]|nr:hypothetical protein [Acidobacteria bacterium AH-259-G07]
MRKRVILLDKSTLQSLSSDELMTLERHFFVNLPPVLIAEILADLRKKNGNGIVAGLFSKLRALNPIPCHDWRTLCRGDMLGDKIPMGQVPTNARLSVSTDGHLEYGEELHPTLKAIDDWRSGLISTQDMQLALDWKKQAKSSVDLQSFRKKFLETFASTGFSLTFDSVQRLRMILDQFLSHGDKANQTSLLELMLTELEGDADFRQRVLDRWDSARNPSLVDFAPYTYICLRTFFIFWFALRGHRRSSEAKFPTSSIYR